MYYVHDVTHCRREQCPKKNKCYRYNAYKELESAKYDGLVSVLNNVDKENYECTMFMSDDIIKKIENDTKDSDNKQ